MCVFSSPHVTRPTLSSSIPWLDALVRWFVLSRISYSSYVQVFSTRIVPLTSRSFPEGQARDKCQDFFKLLPDERLFNYAKFWSENYVDLWKSVHLWERVLRNEVNQELQEKSPHRLFSASSTEMLRHSVTGLPPWLRRSGRGRPRQEYMDGIKEGSMLS